MFREITLPENPTDLRKHKSLKILNIGPLLDMVVSCLKISHIFLHLKKSFLCIISSIEELIYTFIVTITSV